VTDSNDILDRLAPTNGWVSDWPDVLERAEVSHPVRLVTKRRLVIVLALLVAVLAPLAAVGAANDWWFFQNGGGPAPTSAPFVVKTGEWGGHAWQFVAYPSTTDGLCYGITPTSHSANGEGGALACSPFAGIPRTGLTKLSPDMTISDLSSSGTPELPAYIAGPVIDSATSVEIRLTNGQTLHTKTFGAPSPLTRVRFWAIPLPDGVAVTAHPFPSPVSWLAGLNADGTIVACLAPQTAKDGISPISDCH
jgi:hypothetical protein